LRAACNADGCSVSCNDGEIMLTAFCGPKHGAANFSSARQASCGRRAAGGDFLVGACVKVGADTVAPTAAPAQTPPVSHRAGGSIPDFNIEASCRHVSGMEAGSPGSCVADEQGARNELQKDWAQFTAADRSSCAQVSGSDGLPSYVELLTCLQMSADARKLSKENTGRP
jgi:hypothetical protein